MSKALALALEWKVLTKTGNRATTYKAVKQRGPKPQLTLGDQMRVAAVLGKRRLSTVAYTLSWGEYRSARTTPS